MIIESIQNLFSSDFVLKQHTHVYLSFIKCSLDLPGLNFQPSFFTLKKQGQKSQALDKQTRDSVEAYLYHQKLTSTANMILKSDLQSIDEELVEINAQWKMIKYSNGHFIEHSDRIRQVQPYTHYGTQIWLPPKSLCRYEGGILITKDEFKNEIQAHETNWTFIVMPLGVRHEVSQVIGERISFVKPIYIRNPQLQQRYERRRFYDDEDDVQD